MPRASPLASVAPSANADSSASGGTTFGARICCGVWARLQTINGTVSEAVIKGDAVSYIKRNLEFHRTLYLRAQAPAMLAMAETVWLQLGPTMRKLYGRLNRAEVPANHRLILAALRAGDEPGLRLAVRTDVTQGLRMLTG